MAGERSLELPDRAGEEALECASLVSADWSKQPEKRPVCISRMAQRSIERPNCPASGWNLEALLNLAESLACDGPVLVRIDVVLGVSKGYWQLLGEEPNRQFGHFIHWLKRFDPGASCKTPAVGRLIER